MSATVKPDIHFASSAPTTVQSATQELSRVDSDLQLRDQWLHERSAASSLKRSRNGASKKKGHPSSQSTTQPRSQRAHSSAPGGGGGGGRRSPRRSGGGGGGEGGRTSSSTGSLPSPRSSRKARGAGSSKKSATGGSTGKRVGPSPLRLSGSRSSSSIGLPTSSSGGGGSKTRTERVPRHSSRTSDALLSPRVSGGKGGRPSSGGRPPRVGIQQKEVESSTIHQSHHQHSRGGEEPSGYSYGSSHSFVDESVIKLDLSSLPSSDSGEAEAGVLLGDDALSGHSDEDPFSSPIVATSSSSQPRPSPVPALHLRGGTSADDSSYGGGGRDSRRRRVQMSPRLLRGPGGDGGSGATSPALKHGTESGSSSPAEHQLLFSGRRAEYSGARDEEILRRLQVSSPDTIQQYLALVRREVLRQHGALEQWETSLYRFHSLLLATSVPGLPAAPPRQRRTPPLPITLTKIDETLKRGGNKSDLVIAASAMDLRSIPDEDAGKDGSKEETPLPLLVYQNDPTRPPLPPNGGRSDRLGYGGSPTLKGDYENLKKKFMVVVGLLVIALIALIVVAVV